MPWIGIRLIVGRCGNKLGAINHGAAADRQQEIDILCAHHFDRFHQRFVGWVRLNAGKLLHVAARQCGINLIQHAVLLHAAATVGDQNACIGRDLLRQAGNLVLTEQDFGWGMENKVLHG
ncbi:hypothetical protein D3C78_1050610 [compost metagenome]